MCLIYSLNKAKNKPYKAKITSTKEKLDVFAKPSQEELLTSVQLSTAVDS